MLKSLTYLMQAADILSLRTVSVFTPLAAVFNLQPPASSGGLCPFVMSAESKLIASWSLPLLTLAVFLALWPLVQLFSCRGCKRAPFSATFGALLLFLFSSLTSTTASLIQVPLFCSCS